MSLYAVIDADGFVLETWESPFEPQQPRTRQRGDRLVKKTPNATGWVVVEGTCRRGDRLAVDEYGGASLAMEGNAQTYSPFFFKLEGLAAEAEDANYHPLARVLDQDGCSSLSARSVRWRGCSRNRRTGCDRRSGPRATPPACPTWTRTPAPVDTPG